MSSPYPLPLEAKQGALRASLIGQVPLEMGDDVTASPPPEAILTIEFDAAEWREVLRFRLNGHELTDGRFEPAADPRSDNAMSFAVDTPALRPGRNYVDVVTHRAATLPANIATITAMRLRVRYG